MSSSTAGDDILISRLHVPVAAVAVQNLVGQYRAISRISPARAARVRVAWVERDAPRIRNSDLAGVDGRFGKCEGGKRFFVLELRF